MTSAISGLSRARAAQTGQDDRAFAEGVELPDQQNDDAGQSHRQQAEQFLVRLCLILDFAADFPSGTGGQVEFLQRRHDGCEQFGRGKAGIARLDR